MKELYYKRVLQLAVFTIAYNFIEGIVSIRTGTADETLALFGFGADSFVEVISGIGILQTVIRIRMHPESSAGSFEKRALHITGISFFLLAAGLVIGSIINILQNHKPEATIWGIIISVISLIVMFWLYRSKIHFGKKLNADAVIADGKCTQVCIYMSAVLLISSIVFELTGFGWVDTAGAIGLAWFSFREGKEAFEKARGKDCECTHC
jgi:divalent metal cation (Fe/Co/Zn/Cd) transporter